MPQPIALVDAFADRPFAGNPAGVCVLERPADEAWMQLVAREMNQAETAFLVREEDSFRLRWFTPTVEVDLCGHATLASAHLLWEDGHLAPNEPARFLTRSGLLGATREGDRIALDFPGLATGPSVDPAPISEALGAPVVGAWLGKFDHLAEVESESALRSIRPDFGRVAALGSRGLIVTARSEKPGVDFVSRFFGPAVGVPEDPVTGSAHCVLAPFWADRLGRAELTGYQASARGGTVGVRVVAGGRVTLLGPAVTTMRGSLLA